MIITKLLSTSLDINKGAISMTKDIYQTPDMDVTTFDGTDIIVSRPGGEDWETPINGSDYSY